MATTTNYTNVDGVTNAVSSWPNILSGNEYYLDATKISMEIPTVLTSGKLALSLVDTDQYWKSAPEYKTKLVQYNTFKTRYSRATGTTSIYIDGRKLSESEYTNLDTLHFQINTDVPDGYLWVSYYPTLIGNTYPFGDIVKSISATTFKMVADHKLPLFSTGLLVRMRRVINNIEGYYGISPTVWLGGFNNDVLSTHSNIVPFSTLLCSDHVTELQYAIKRIVKYMENFIPVELSELIFSKLAFTEVQDTDSISIDMLNEISYALLKIETEIIALSDYGRG